MQTVDDFIDTFPIGLDCDCGDDGEDLVDKKLEANMQTT